MNVKRMPKFLCILTAVILALSMMPLSSFAEEPETEEVHHYLAFASDLHADPDHLFEDARSVLSRSMKGFPEEIDYMSLIGDIAGDGGAAPEYKASDIYGAAAEATQTENWHLLEQYFSVICSEQDTNVEKDVAGAGFLNKEASEEFFRGVSSDGITYCYVYGIGYSGMTEGGQASRESADLFKHWIRNKDTTIPVIVLSHYPVQAMCGDNPGAACWNEALNFAATGVEGITGEDDSHAVIRNVIFLSGHNHIKDETEYVFRAGSKMTVQADTTQEGSEDAENFVSTVYYNSITPGYLCSSGNSLLMDLTEDTITITKYNNGSEVSLGTDGTTGEAVGSSISLQQFRKDDEGGPVITKQPENAEVSYPDGAVFSVEVEDPDNVSSYQWYMLDKEDQLFFLEGASARTDTLIVPSTQRMNKALRFYCMITDKEGLRTASRQAVLELDNREEDIPVFYVGEYAVKPGETLDLSATDIGDGYKLGSGRVSFDSNAKDITIENLDYDNSHTTAGLITAPNVGLDMECMDPEQEEFNVIFSGENRIMNTYYNYDFNVGGIPFDFYIVGDGKKPLVNFIGDGTLSITNGYNAIRIIGDLMIGIDITVNQNRTEYADGIAANHILVSEGRKLDLTVNGYAFYASGNLFMKDAEVDILANTPHISKGTVTKSTLLANGAISLENTRLNVRSVSDQALCGSTAGNNVIRAEGELFITNGSEVNCEIEAIGDKFAYQLTGISTLNGLIEDSSVRVKMDSDSCVHSIGLYAEEDYQFTNSELKVDMRSDGTVYGVVADRDFNAGDSDVDVKAATFAKEAGDTCYGLVCENAVFKATDQKYAMKFAAEGGMALVCDPGRGESKTYVGYEENYEAKNLYLRDGTECLTPEKNAASLGSVLIPGRADIAYAVVETIYDLEDTSAPAEEVVFGLKGGSTGSPFEDVDEGRYYYDAVDWAVKHDPQITNGTDPTHFSPEGICTRGQVVTFLWRAAGCPEPVSSENQFRDADPDAFYYKAMLWAVEQGITNGTSGTTFSPDDPCTRCQVVTFLHRAAGGPAPAETANPFGDVADGAYYYNAVLWAVNHDPQITNGLEADVFGTDVPCTRGQIVTFLYRAG